MTSTTICTLPALVQEAAGIFAHIGGTLHQRMPPPLPADMAADSTATLQALCLAQVCASSTSDHNACVACFSTVARAMVELLHRSRRA